MCKCTPEIRTPFCGRGDCLPPASREPTESLFAANAEAAAQASLDRVWAQAIRQSQLATSEQPTKLTAQELLAELATLRTQLEQAQERETALKEALDISPDDVGRIMHESWTRTKLAQGFHLRPPKETGEWCDKCHADLIPWEDLPEAQKDINRHAFDDVLAEIRARAISGEQANG